MPRPDEPWRVVKTSQATFQLLELVKERGPITAAELVDRVDMSRSTVHDHLKTLELEGFIVKQDEEYVLSLKLLEYGCAARDRDVDAELVQPSINRLAEQTEETAWFSVEERGRLVHLHKSMGEQALTLGDRVGNHHQLHYYAAGKAILAHLPERRVEEILDANGLESHTDTTITDREVLNEELESVRREGVAFNDGEFNDSTRGIAAPVLVDDAVVGAVAVHGPTNRLHGEYFQEELAQQVKACANEIELKLLRQTSDDIF